RTVDCDQHTADVRLALRLRRINKDRMPLSCNISFTGGGLNLTQTLDFRAQDDLLSTILHIERPILWWPKGYGVQHLYHVKAELIGRDGEVLDTIEKDFGIRAISLIRNKDQYGHKFEFEVNGQPIYIKGANWLPLSIHPTSPAKDEYESILTRLTDGHFNMLRVWAGGYYEDPAFYELCDKLGILVWQDFMFASAYYPDRQWFKDAVKIEARRIIERLRNHPSVAIWCGNSRIDHLHETGRLGTGRKFYGKSIYHKLLPGLLSELDPTREYIPTTPFAEADNKDHNAPASGSTHSWDLWNNYASAAECVASETFIPRFIAEFGLQSIPEIETLSSFCKPQELRIASAQLEKHCYQPGGFGRMARYITEEYTPPKDLAAAVWQSQVVQGRSLKHYVEHLRAMNHINAGCLIWTLSDFSPAVSFSILDYQRSPKAIYYYARRFFAPILIAFINDKQSHTVKAVIVNDSPSPITGTLNCSMNDFNGHVVDSIQIPVRVSPYAKSSPLSLPKTFSHPAVPARTFLTASLQSDDTCLAENTHLFGADKHLQLPASDVELEIEHSNNKTWIVTLLSKTLVRDLQLCPPEPAAISDNFITLLPNIPKTVTVQYNGQVPSVRTPMRIFSANQMRSMER
ncbi:MAG: beta-mannosidase, partial [Planctomycetota bacterium]